MLNEFFQRLRARMKVGKSVRLIDLALGYLDLYPKLPETNTTVTLSYEDVHLYITYTDYKVELRDSLRESWEGGGESVQRFIFTYEINYRERLGDIDEFRLLLFDVLENVDLKDISVSDEE